LKGLCGSSDTTKIGEPQWEDPEGFELDVPVSENNEDNLVTKEQWLRTGSPRAATVWDLGEVAAGWHIRTAIVWQHCHKDANEDGVAYEIRPQMNYDLQVCDFDTGECIAGSESLHDTTEGVDFRVPDDYQDVKVRLYKPAGQVACDGSDSQWYWSGYTIYRN